MVLPAGCDGFMLGIRFVAKEGYFCTSGTEGLDLQGASFNALRKMERVIL